MKWLGSIWSGAGESLTDLFWTVATSDVVLLIVGGIAACAIVVSHVPLIRWVPTIDNWMKLASAIGYVALFVLGVLIGHRLADERTETKRLTGELEWSRNQLEQQEATARDAERLKAEAEAEARAAEGRLDEYRAKFSSAPAAVCAFTDDDLRRLRTLRPRRARQHLGAGLARM